MLSAPSAAASPAQRKAVNLHRPPRGRTPLPACFYRVKIDLTARHRGDRRAEASSSSEPDESNMTRMNSRASRVSRLDRCPSAGGSMVRTCTGRGHMSGATSATARRRSGTVISGPPRIAHCSAAAPTSMARVKPRSSPIKSLSQLLYGGTRTRALRARRIPPGCSATRTSSPGLPGPPGVTGPPAPVSPWRGSRRQRRRDLPFRRAARGELAVRARDAVMLPQGRAGVLGAEQAALAQDRDHVLDEGLQA
jgi:hypothetical protein